MDGAVERIRCQRRVINFHPVEEKGQKTAVFPVQQKLTHTTSLVARELELELAQTKLALVETECKNQDLTHQLTVTQVSILILTSTLYSKIFKH